MSHGAAQRVEVGLAFREAENTRILQRNITATEAFAPIVGPKRTKGSRSPHLSDDCGGIDVGSSQRRLQDRRAGHELPQRNRRPLDDASVEHRDGVQVLPEESVQPLAHVLFVVIGCTRATANRKGAGGTRDRQLQQDFAEPPSIFTTMPAPARPQRFEERFHHHRHHNYHGRKNYREYNISRRHRCCCGTH